MKKFTLMFVALVAFAWSANAQVQGGADYVNETTQAADYVIVGSTMPYYARPDMLIHPNYTAVGTWALTPGYTWTWVTPGCTQANATNNYVEVTFPAAPATVNMTVAEQAPSGGCADATPSTHTVTVIAKPTIAANGTYPEATMCNGGSFTLTPAPVTTYGDAADGGARVWYTVKSYNATWGGAAWVVGAEVNANVLQVTQTNQVLASAITLTEASATFDVQNSATTIYIVYANGLTSDISRKSDFLAMATNVDYANTTNMIAADVNIGRVIVNPTPSTGEIYHVKNDWSIN